ncbi:B3 domain-containing protein At5g60130 [Coffea arabica]|uniref:B3 domain-containing protein At5g60130 n=1 Tax=Coffea arabica TaxID=13443 RepID=A0ABM4UXJ8_COFAR
MVKGKRKDDSNRIPAFFKVFIPNTSTERLKIPIAFTKMMQGSLPDKASLRDRYGNIWPVELARIENASFFLEGRAKFVKDNSVELGDFLVFHFDGNCVFNVKLLGHTACDKKGVGGRMFKVKEEEENEKEEDKKGENENLQNNYNTVDETDHNEEYNAEEEEEEEEEMRVQQKAKSNQRAAKPKASCKGLKKIKKSINGPPDLVSHKSGTEASKCNLWKAKRIDAYGFNLFKSGKIPQPKNPYFVTKVRTKRQDELYVPVDVVKDHNLEFPPEIVLHDPKEREWRARLRRWSDGRVWYCGGWRSLCRLNLVGEEDICVCEFVKREGGGLRINVTFVRPEDLA